MLRLFNDPLGMLFLYASVYFLCVHKWRMASITYSLALSIKMNALLFLPGLCVVLFMARGALGAVGELLLVAAAQVLIGLPFIMHDSSAYFSSAFDLSRAFLFKWTVNWRFLGPELFTNPITAKVLLMLHVFTLLLFGVFRWTSLSRSFSWLTTRWNSGGQPPSAKCTSVTDRHFCHTCNQQLDWDDLCPQPALSILQLVCIATSITSMGIRTLVAAKVRRC